MIERNPNKDFRQDSNSLTNDKMKNIQINSQALKELKEHYSNYSVFRDNFSHMIENISDLDIERTFSMQEHSLSTMKLTPATWDILLDTKIIDWNRFMGECDRTDRITMDHFNTLARFSTRQFPHHMGETITPKVTTTVREEILEKAIKEVCTVKADSYGKPEDSFKAIADLWSAYFENLPPIKTEKGIPKEKIFSPKDVAVMMILLKVAREIAKHKEDNLIDIAGYAACAAEVAEQTERQHP